MSKLSKKTIQDLQKIISEDYGKSLSLKEVGEIGDGLVSYFDTLFLLNHRIKNDARDVSLCNENTSGVLL